MLYVKKKKYTTYCGVIEGAWGDKKEDLPGTAGNDANKGTVAVDILNNNLGNIKKSNQIQLPCFTHFFETKKQKMLPE